jgi:hypothetical protein
MKNPLTPAGIETETFRIVAQHLNHCATAVSQVFKCSIRYSCQIFMKIEFFSDQFSKNTQYQISRNSVQWERSCFMRTDKEAGMT